MQWLRFQPHYQLRNLEQWLKRPDEINIEWVTSTIEEAETLLDMARDLNMPEQAKTLEEVIRLGDELLGRLMKYAGE